MCYTGRSKSQERPIKALVDTVSTACSIETMNGWGEDYGRISSPFGSPVATFGGNVYAGNPLRDGVPGVEPGVQHGSEVSAKSCLVDLFDLT